MDSDARVGREADKGGGMIETLDDIIEWLEDQIGVYGAHDLNECEKPEKCRLCWTSDLRTYGLERGIYRAHVASEGVRAMYCLWCDNNFTKDDFDKDGNLKPGVPERGRGR